jgi:hypothetical protein
MHFPSPSRAGEICIADKLQQILQKKHCRAAPSSIALQSTFAWNPLCDFERDFGATISRFQLNGKEIHDA